MRRPTLPRPRRRQREHFIVSSYAPPWLKDRMVPGEFVVMATRLHWASLAEPVLQALGVFVIVLVLDAKAPAGLEQVVAVGWMGVIVMLGRIGWKVIDHHIRWFVATNKRLWLRQGIIKNEIAMMPLIKVTDLRYERSLLSHLPMLDYGRFVMENAGQEQALRQVDWVPHPDAVHLSISTEMFGQAPDDDDLQDSDDETDDNDDNDDNGGRGDDGGGGDGRGRGGGGNGGGGNGSGGNGGSSGRARLGGLRRVRWKVGQWTGRSTPPPYVPTTGPISSGTRRPKRPDTSERVGSERVGSERSVTERDTNARATVGSVRRERESRHADPVRPSTADPEREWSDPFPDVASTNARGNPVQDRLNSYSRAIPVQSGESVYQSPDRRGDKADTGPVSIFDDPTSH